MSLGFLTESALIPQKSKEIKIDPGIVSFKCWPKFVDHWFTIDYRRTGTKA